MSAGSTVHWFTTLSDGVDWRGNKLRIFSMKVNDLVLDLSTKMAESRIEVWHWSARLVDSCRLSTSTNGIKKDKDKKE